MDLKSGVGGRASAFSAVTKNARWRWCRRLRSALVAGAALCWVAAGAAPPAAAGVVAVRAAPHSGYGRIVFDWPSPITFTATLHGEQLDVNFPRPFTGDLTPIVRHLKGYTVSARTSASGREIVIDLARPVTLHQMTVSGHLVVLDLRTEHQAARWQSAQAAKPVTTAKATSRAKKLEKQRETEQAEHRAATRKPHEHPGKTAPAPAAPVTPARSAASLKPGRIAVTARAKARETLIVFHLRHRRTFTLHQRGDHLAIGFAEPLSFDLDALNQTPPPGVISATSAQGLHDGHPRADVAVHLVASGHVRFSRHGAEIVIQIPLSPKARAAWKRALAQSQAVAKGTHPAAASGPEPRAEAAASPPSGPAPGSVAPPSPARGLKPAGHKLPPAPIAPVRVAALPAGAQAALASGHGGESVVVGTSPLNPGLRLTFPWREAVAAAVYQRADVLWLVFDHPARIDFAALENAGATASILGARGLGVPGASVVRLMLAPGLGPSVSRDGSEWVVDLKPATKAPLARPIEVEAEPHERTGPRVFLPVTGLGHEVDFTDPDIGDPVRVVPLKGDGFGVNLRHQYPQFTLLSSAQGIVILPKADGLLVQPLQNGLQIAAAGGLLLSERPGYQAADRWLFHIADWRGAPGQFTHNEDRLLLAVAVASPDARTAARRDLARFYFANRFFTEAEAVLVRLKDRNPAQGEGPGFHSLQGAVLVGMRRYAEAAKVLKGADLTFDPQAALWRGLIAVRAQNWKAAVKDLRAGAAVLDAYPPDWRGQFLIAGAKAALGVGDRRGAQATLAALKMAKLSEDEQAEAMLLQGRIASLKGKKSAAAALYAKVAASPSLPSAAKARLDLVNTELALHRISNAQAIDRLERLRFSWRGDATELAVENRLGQLYIAENRPHQGLIAWRRAIHDFPTAPLAGKLAKASAAEFRKLFLDGGANHLPPIEALAIYYDFRTLTPQDSDGDAMIRNLADRLVSLDLLDRAADLLNYQVTHRLKGEEKARVGARLAVVQLLNNKPDAALAALAESAVTPLSKPLALERGDLQARAEADQGKTDAALALIKGDGSLAAQKLRADINWRAKRWKAAAVDLWGLLGKRDQDPAPLDAAERQKVMQLAVALSLGGDEKGLAELRQRFGTRLDGTPEADGFRVITSASDHGGSDYRQLTNAIASVKQLESFMSGYRTELHKGKLSAID